MTHYRIKMIQVWGVRLAFRRPACRKALHRTGVLQPNKKAAVLFCFVMHEFEAAFFYVLCAPWPSFVVAEFLLLLDVFKMKLRYRKFAPCNFK